MERAISLKASQDQGGDLRSVKFGIIGAVDAVPQLFLRKIRKEQLDHLIGCLPVIRSDQGLEVKIERRDVVRHEESAILRESFQDRLGSRQSLLFSSGAAV